MRLVSSPIGDIFAYLESRIPDRVIEGQGSGIEITEDVDLGKARQGWMVVFIFTPKLQNSEPLDEEKTLLRLLFFPRPTHM